MPLLPGATRGDIFLDARGDARALRVTGHVEHGLVVLSLWRGAECIGTSRLSTADAARLADVLAALVGATADGQALAAR